MDTPRARDAERRIAADQWDTDAWMMLATEAERLPLSAAKPVYERLVAQFPPAGRFWKTYADHVARDTGSSPEDVIAVFKRAVSHAPTSIDLWRTYLSFVSTRCAKESSASLETAALDVHEAALAATGLDLNAHVLWTHFIDFISNNPTMTDTQRRDYLRRVYQRAVQTPLQNVEQFWNNYVTFENANNTSKETARTIIAELQPKNSDARAEARARRTRREGLNLQMLPLPPRGRSKEVSQRQQWRRFIKHESTNPFQLTPDKLFERVSHAYEAALAPMYRCPDFWCEYLNFVYTALSTPPGDPSDPSSSAATSGPNASGANGKNGAVNSNANNSAGGNGKIGSNGKDDAAGTASAKTRARVRESLEPLLERALQALPSSIGMHVYVNSLYVRIGLGARGVSVLESLCQKHGSPEAYVHLMRAARKQDGRDAARKAFGKARKDSKGSSPKVYIAAAMMEFQVNKDSKVARNVFEFGLKNFQKNAVMALHYINWLCGQGDNEYARVVMRKVMPEPQGTPDEVRQLWERWLELEESVGDAASVDQVMESWKSSGGVGRSESVMDDVLRMSRCLGMEGLSEEEIAGMDTGRAGKGEVSNATGGASAGGKRDPRTGRRVGGAKDGGGSGGGNAKNSGGRKGGPDGNSVLKTAVDSLQRLGNMLSIAKPLPALGPESIDMALQIVMQTPDTFEKTPVGQAEAEARRKEGGGGKKRKAGEDMGMGLGPLGGLGVLHSNGMLGSQGQDVFRARQAAKQSRLR